MEIDAHTPELVAVGVDGSPTGQAALAWAADQASVHGRPLYVFHCWQQPTLAMAALPGAYPPEGAAWEAEVAARTLLEEALGWLRDCYPQLPVSGDLLQGPAGARLAAHIRHGDVLVLGMSSRHRVTARMLGSTLEHLLRHARCRVVVIPPESTLPPGDTGTFAGHVVAAVGGTESEDHGGDQATISAVLGAGFTEAAAHRLPLAILHADDLRPEPVGSVLDRAAFGQSLSRAIESWHAVYPQVAVRRAAVSGTPAGTLHVVAEGAALLVIGRSSHPLRPVRLVDHLLTRVTCPVAVVPPIVATERSTQGYSVPRSALWPGEITHPVWARPQ